MRMLTGLRARNVRVRVLTNSLQSTDAPVTFAAYSRYRAPIIEAGIELYEVRPHLGAPTMPGGGSLRSSSAIPFALHAKVFVFDRRQVFIGSMNYDERSRNLNTELGVLIESPDLANEVAERFEAVAQPANSYVLSLGPPNIAGQRPVLWRTEENGSPIVYDDEPGVDVFRRFNVKAISFLPIESQL
jgi:putative cardiolipin synthase